MAKYELKYLVPFWSVSDSYGGCYFRMEFNERIQEFQTEAKEQDVIDTIENKEEFREGIAVNYEKVKCKLVSHKKIIKNWQE
jgi:hypothetical protein